MSHRLIKRRGSRSVVESLEDRRLMAVDVGINFQPAGTPLYAGYLADTGSTYADRGNGYTYGWTSANNNARDRNASNSTDQRYDTFNHMQVGGNKTWEISLPNGQYQVTLAAGDASYFNSVYKINAEGVSAIDATPSSANRWITNTLTVNVTDGKLTLSNAAGASNNKINFIQISGDGVEPPPPPPPAQNGLKGEYFDNQDLTNLKVTRTDSTVNFNWGTGSPDASIGVDTFSARWSGFVQPAYSENYRFYVDANNGVRLWVNDQLVIDRWTNAYGEASGTIGLQAGMKYAIKLEYFDFDNNANAKLSWSSASRAKQVIPTSALFTGNDSTPGNAAPSVSITSPGNNATFDAGDDVTIVASASDTDGNVAKVQFFANGNYLGEDLSSIFDTVWDNAPAGTYTITAIATDDDGATKTSAPITITINAPSGSTTINWQQVKASPTTRFEAPSLVIDGKVWLFGGWHWENADQRLHGLRRVDVYDPATNTWSRKADLPSEVTHAGYVRDGNFIYLVGGFVGPDPGAATSDVWRYSISANTWTKMTWQLPRNLAAGAALLIGRTLHWIGGSEADRTSDTGSHWTLDIDNPSAGWTARANLPNARHHFSAAAVNGKIYVFGGQHGHDTETRIQDNSAHVYDPATNAWSAIRNLPRAVSHAEPGTFVMNGKIYIAGGMTTDRVVINNLTEYDPATNTYRELTPLPNALTAPVVQLLPNGKLFVSCGTAAVGGAQSKSWIGTFV